MKQYYAAQDRTLVEIADVLGIQPDIVLEWIIEGRLLVAFQGDRTLLLVDRNNTLKDRNSGKVLILSNQICSERWFAFSC